MVPLFHTFLRLAGYPASPTLPPHSPSKALYDAPSKAPLYDPSPVVNGRDAGSEGHWKRQFVDQSKALCEAHEALRQSGAEYRQLHEKSLAMSKDLQEANVELAQKRAEIKILSDMKLQLSNNPEVDGLQVLGAVLFRAMHAVSFFVDGRPLRGDKGWLLAVQFDFC